MYDVWWWGAELYRREVSIRVSCNFTHLYSECLGLDSPSNQTNPQFPLYECQLYSWNFNIHNILSILHRLYVGNFFFFPPQNFNLILFILLSSWKEETGLLLLETEKAGELKLPAALCDLRTSVIRARQRHLAPPSPSGSTRTPDADQQPGSQHSCSHSAIGSLRPRRCFSLCRAVVDLY